MDSDNWEREKEIREGVLAVVLAFVIFGFVLLAFRGCAGSPASVQPPPGVTAPALSTVHPSEAREPSLLSTIWSYCVAGALVLGGVALGLVLLAICAAHWREILVAVVWLVIIFCVFSFAIFVVIGAITVIAGVVKKIEDK